MKKTIQHISLLLAVLLTAGLSSCIKDDYADTSKDTATVNLVFSTRQPGQEVTVQGVENENIKTLRVYLTDAEGNVEIQAFKKYTGNETSVTLTFMGVSVGTKNFYVIANEASVGLGEAELGENVVTKIDDAFLNRVITNPAGNAYFPKMRNQINELGLPITGMLEDVEIVEGVNKEIEIPITRAVAKVVLNVTNKSSEDIDLTGLTFGNFFVNKTNLFPGRTTVPSGISVTGYSYTFDAPITIPADETPVQVFTCYLYETPEGEDYEERFTLSLSNNNGLDLEAKKFLTGIPAIKRNNQVEIEAIISRETAVDVNVTLRWEVQDWNSVNVNVPSFD